MGGYKAGDKVLLATEKQMMNGVFSGPCETVVIRRLSKNGKAFEIETERSTQDGGDRRYRSVSLSWWPVSAIVDVVE